MRIYPIVMKEIYDQVLKRVPKRIKDQWRFVRINKPQVKADDIHEVVFSYDSGGIIISSNNYVCTTNVQLPEYTINQSLIYEPRDTVKKEILISRVYHLSDPQSLDKASGFLIKMIQDYLCPYQKPIRS